MTAPDPAAFPPPAERPVPLTPMPLTPMPMLTVDRNLLATAQAGTGDFTPRITHPSGEVTGLPARWMPPPEPEPEPESTEVRPVSRPHFHARQPIPGIGAAIFVVLVPVALALISALAGLHFQRIVEVYERGETPLRGDVVDPINDLVGYLSVVGAVGIVAGCLWSFLAVMNTNRVCRSLRTPWIAVAGWIAAPALGMLAHEFLDKRLDSGALIGLSVFLAASYLPFGTLGGAAKDLGGSEHLARTWFLASVVGAFLLIVGVGNVSQALNVDDPKGSMEIRSFSCYLAAIMFVAASALALATARNLDALVHHRWLREIDPTGTHQDPAVMKIKRSGRRLRRRLTPTLFLRIAVTAGIAGVGVFSVISLFDTRGRALGMTDVAEAVERDRLIDQAQTRATSIGIVMLAVHAVYVAWAIVAARNAHRRSLMAPTPWAVVASFLLGPAVMLVGWRVGGPLGAAIFVVGLAMAFGGFLVGQLVLGRTVTALGGQGRIFLGWLLADVAMGIVGAVCIRFTDTRAQLIAFGCVQMLFVAASAILAWTAMTRFDRTVREYHAVSNSPTADAQRDRGVGSDKTHVAPDAFTSSHS
jgi:hypothetical protein